MYSMNKLAATFMAAGLFGAAHAAEKITVDAALTQATLIDVAAGTRTTGQSVLLRGDTIVAVVEDAQLTRYAPKPLIKLPGKYLMPGLWDTHVHFGGGEALIEENRQLLPLYLPISTRKATTPTTTCSTSAKACARPMPGVSSAPRRMDPKRSRCAMPSSSSRPSCCPCWRRRASVSSPAPTPVSSTRTTIPDKRCTTRSACTCATA